jgi:hypothetical protein
MIETRIPLARDGNHLGVLDDWMPIVHFLHRHGRSPGRSREVRTIDHRLASFGARSGHHRPARTVGHVTDRGAMDRRAGNRGHSFDWDAAVNNRGIIHRIVINDRRVVVDASHLGWRQPAVVEVALIEIMEANKGKVIRTKAEIEVQSYVDAIKAPAEAHFKDGAGR